MELKFSMRIFEPTRLNHKHVICLESPYTNYDYKPGDITIADTRRSLHPARCWAWLEYKKIG